MPIEFQTCLDRDLLYARWYGPINFEQFEQNFARYLGDVHYRPGRPELIDQSRITDIDINFNLVRSILRQVNDQDPAEMVSTHTVIYAPTDTVFGVARMYQTLAEAAQGIQVEVFQTEAEVLSALGLSHGSIPELLRTETFHPAELRADFEMPAPRS